MELIVLEQPTIVALVIVSHKTVVTSVNKAIDKVTYRNKLTCILLSPLKLYSETGQKVKYRVQVTFTQGISQIMEQNDPDSDSDVLVRLSSKHFPLLLTLNTVNNSY